MKSYKNVSFLVVGI